MLKDSSLTTSEGTIYYIPVQKTLCRSSKDRWFFGVCGGFAEYFGVSSLLMRLLFVFSGAGRLSLTGASGNVSLTIPESAAPKVVAKSNLGNTSNTFDDAKFNDESPVVTVKTNVGNIRIKKD